MRIAIFVCIIASHLLANETFAAFSFNQQSHRLVITHSGKPVAEYVFRDEKILRPYFANVYAPGGVKATRNHPPIAGKDATDHDTMHPGITLGFGDLSGEDFWRNKGTIRHERFVEGPKASDGSLSFTSENLFVTSEGKAIAKQISKITLTARDNGWLLIWDATISPTSDGFYFGDQEEMGFCVRVATPITEKNGGRIANSEGATSAKQTWGQPAKWCDYSGVIDGRQVGLMVIPDAKNFRPSWWHNRDYGVFVANPFGQKAMKQGETSRIEVKKGDEFRLQFAVFIHSSSDTIDLAKIYSASIAQLSP